MPYRRLPNTDQARLRALKAAVRKAADLSVRELAFSQSTLLQLKGFYPHFEQVLQQYQHNRERQAGIGKLLGEHFKAARLYVSHFLQVLNFCIARGELKPQVRKFFNIDPGHRSVPEIGTEQQLLDWGKVVIQGEEARMATGATRIYNPSLAMVKVKYEKFEETYNLHKDLLATSTKLMEKVAEFRTQADRLIIQLWNEIESFYEHLEPVERRRRCSDFGVVYVYRPSEKEDGAGGTVLD